MEGEEEGEEEAEEREARREDSSAGAVSQCDDARHAKYKTFVLRLEGNPLKKT